VTISLRTRRKQCRSSFGPTRR